MIYRFFTPKKICTRNDLDQLIRSVREKLRSNFSGRKYDSFIHLLNQRLSAFDYHILNTISSSEKQLYINACHAFITCIGDCITEYNNRKADGMEDSVNLFDFVHIYYNSSAYLRVGGVKGEHTLTSFDQAATALAVLSGLIITSSIVVFAFSFPVALMVAAIGFTLLAPSLFYIMAETHVHEGVVQKQEETLFLALNDLIISHDQLNDDLCITNESFSPV